MSETDLKNVEHDACGGGVSATADRRISLTTNSQVGSLDDLGFLWLLTVPRSLSLTVS